MGSNNLKRRLFEGEREIRSFGSLTLTSHRVILYSRRRGGESSTSALLKHVQWTHIEQLNRRMLTAATGVVVSLAIINVLIGYTEATWPLMALTALLGGLWAFGGRTRLVVGVGRRQLILPFKSSAHRRRQAREAADLIEQMAARAGQSHALPYPM